MKRSILLIGASLAWMASAHGQLYRCSEGGQSVLRNRPCDAQAPQLPPGAALLGSAATAGPGQMPAIPERSPKIVQGRIVGIIDGDTVSLLDTSRRQHRIRISGIDAPEQTQPFGQRAKSSLAALAFDREASAECRTHRQFQETCVVRINGLDLGLEQLRAGMAWWYRPSEVEEAPRTREEYERAAFEAKAQRLGLWADKNPIEPWNWRRSTGLEE